MLLKYITLASGFNYFLLALVLLIKNAPNKKATNIMGVFFLTMSFYSYIVSFRYSSIEAGNFENLTYYFPIDGVFLLLLGPCIYVFIRSILNNPLKLLQWKNIIHLIPFIPFVIFNIFFLTKPYQTRIDWFLHDFEKGTIETNLLNIILYIQIPVYLFLSFKLIQRKLAESSFVYVNNTKIDVSWIKTFLIINITYIFLTAPLCFYLANEKANIIIGSIGMDIQFIYLFIKVSWQKDAGTTRFFNQNNSKIKNKSLKLNEQFVDDYLYQLENYMKTNKPYLQEDCNLQIIAEKTGIAHHHLSGLINNKLQKNFSDYINEFRVNESIELLKSENSEKLTIEALGFMCGFGSKSSFNKAFKKHTNITPSAFRNNLKSSIDL